MFCLLLLFIGGLLSANEFKKLSAWLAIFTLGVTGLLSIFPRMRPFNSRLMVATWLVFFVDIAIRGFLRLYFGVRPNPSEIFSTVAHSSLTEARELVISNWHLWGQVLLLSMTAAICAIAAERYLRRQPQSPSLALKLISPVMLAGLIALHFNPVMRQEQPLLFWPLQYQDYRVQAAETDTYAELMQEIAPVSEWRVSYNGEEKNTVVLILSESVNRNNMSLYGYPRQTTPMLDSVQEQLLVFRNVISSDPLTIPSLTKMLTPANLSRPDDWRHKPNVLAIAKQAGYKTFWLSNQISGDGWVSLTAAQADQSVFINHASGWGESNMDGNLLPPLQQALSDAADKKFIIVHLWGSHFAYNHRYPKEYTIFGEDQVSAEMTAAGRAQWVISKRNEYDNSILYGDHVLHRFMKEIKNHPAGTPTSMLYVSDHGQEVGHYRDHASHSGIDKSGYEIPLIAWFSQARNFPAAASMLNRAYQTDYLDTTLCGLLKINTAYYQEQRDIFSDKFLPIARSMWGKEYVN